MQTRFFIIFCCIAAGDLYGRLLQDIYWDIVFKPLIIPALVIYMGMATAWKFPDWLRWIGIGLFFSWLGDLLLIKQEWFILGLLSFLLAQISYILGYLRSVAQGSQPFFIKKYPYSVLPFVALVVGFYAFTAPHMEAALRIPVLVYASMVSSMALFAMARYGNSSPKSFWQVFTGALLFVISDFCIGINQFVMHGQMPLGGIIIMSTYIAAQYLIVTGCLAQMRSAIYPKEG